MAASYKFEDFLDDALRDRFLCRLRSSLIQSKLLAEGGKLTFEKALEMALVIENAESNVRPLHPSYSRDSTGNRPTGTEINVVKGSKSYSKKRLQ